MKPDDNDKLWELLGKSREPTVSPFFARNVLRTVRQDEAIRPDRTLIFGLSGAGMAAGQVFVEVFVKLSLKFRRWLWRIALASACCAIVLVNVAPNMLARHHHRAPGQENIEKEIVANPDYDVINHLDELKADEESSLWLDDSANSIDSVN